MVYNRFLAGNSKCGSLGFSSDSHIRPSDVVCNAAKRRNPGKRYGPGLKYPNRESYLEAELIRKGVVVNKSTFKKLKQVGKSRGIAFNSVTSQEALASRYTSPTPTTTTSTTTTSTTQPPLTPPPTPRTLYWTSLQGFKELSQFLDNFTSPHAMVSNDKVLIEVIDGRSKAFKQNKHGLARIKLPTLGHAAHVLRNYGQLSPSPLFPPKRITFLSEDGQSLDLLRDNSNMADVQRFIQTGILPPSPTFPHTLPTVPPIDGGEDDLSSHDSM